MIALETNMQAGPVGFAIFISTTGPEGPEPLGSLFAVRDPASGSRQREVAHHAVRIGPKVQGARDELGPLIDPDGFGMPVVGANSPKDATDVWTGEPLAGPEGWDVASVRIVHGEDPQAASGEERVMNDVRQPEIIGHDRVSPNSAPRCGFWSRTHRLCVFLGARYGFV